MALQAVRQPRWQVAISWALVIAWACFIFYASSNSGNDLNDGSGWFSHIYQALRDWQLAALGPGVDVISSAAHFCEYAVFGGLWLNALRFHLPLRKACLLAVACASVYGVSDEFHQLFVPDRMCDPVDWLVDTAGACLGMGIARLVLRRVGVTFSTPRQKLP